MNTFSASEAWRTRQLKKHIDITMCRGRTGYPDEPSLIMDETLRLLARESVFECPDALGAKLEDAAE